jgi:prephenate dehydrogenase
MPIQQITILGAGLIGGSLGLAFKRQGVRVVGWDRKEVLAKVQQLRIFDRTDADPVEACKGSEVVVLAAPVGGIIDLIERVGPLLPESTLLTDVGSTKVEIMARARAVFGDAASRRFLGGHPMAGKERSGIEHADPQIFAGAAWLFINNRDSVAAHPLPEDFVRLIESISARPIFMGAEEHDRLCAWISHLPQMLSTALASALLEEAAENPAVHEIGGRALREMTRIASSPYSMWRDIAHTNTENIAEAIHKLEQRLAHIRENLKTPELRAEFDRANKFRQG